MHVKVLSVSGYFEALFGLGFSYGLTSQLTFQEFLAHEDLIERMAGIAEKLKNRGSSHNKYLRQIQIIADMDLPLYVWSQFDTYKIGTTAQSESKMHTLGKTILTQDDFEWPITQEELDRFNIMPELEKCRTIRVDFLQRRIVALNATVLCNIMEQRSGHKLNTEWQTIIANLYDGMCAKLMDLIGDVE